MSYSVYLRDSSLNVIEQLDLFNKVELKLKFNDTSTWILNWSPAYPTSAKDDRIIAGLIFGGGLVVKRDDIVLLSGPIRKISLDWNKDKFSYQLSGVDDTGILSDRLALPVPLGPPYDTAAEDVQNGPAETLLHYYTNYNAGPAAIATRQITGLTMSNDTGLGTVITYRARFIGLLTCLQEIALQGGGLGFRVVQSGAGRVFQVYYPTDKTASVKFSPELGNLTAYKYTEEMPADNYVYVGGQNEGMARTVVETSDSDSIGLYGRIEKFIDARTYTTTDELTEQAVTELATSAEKKSLSVTPIDIGGMEYGKDYNLGDTVTVVMGSKTIQDVIREVNLTIDSGGVVVKPNIGSANIQSNEPLSGTLKKLRAIDLRLAKLEAR